MALNELFQAGGVNLSIMSKKSCCVSTSGASGITELTTAFRSTSSFSAREVPVGDLRGGGQRVHERVLAGELRGVTDLIFELVRLT
ncbi:hypothetical protein [Micromonospora luteifusca]|uniref:hypothetical protein n=1 Tax=Micromonospora luteifusca TaxID=709860 RepID=UPI0033A12261